MNNPIRPCLIWLVSIGVLFSIASSTVPLLHIRNALAAQSSPPLPPAIFYGTILSNDDFTPTVGMVLQAYIGNNLCGQTETEEKENAITFAIPVASDASQSGCGAIGHLIQFRVTNKDLLPAAEWDNRQPRELTLRYTMMATPTATATIIPTHTPTPTPFPTATPTATTVPVVEDWLYLSSSSGGRIGNIRFADEDILAYSFETNTWMFVLDGSDVGLASFDIDAVDYQDDGSFLLSLDKDGTIPGVGIVGDEDILRFSPIRLGSDTQGSFAIYFDGSDVELTTSGEDIDAFTRLSDGTLLLSTIGTAKVDGIRANDEDILLFAPTQLGSDTVGRWSLAFSGRSTGLSDASEDIWGVATKLNGALFVSTLGSFNVMGAKGSGADILLCNNPSSGIITSCIWDFYWIGSNVGFGQEIIDALDIVSQNAHSKLSRGIVDSVNEPMVEEGDDDFNSDEDDEPAEQENTVMQDIFVPIVLR